MFEILLSYILAHDRNRLDSDYFPIFQHRYGSETCTRPPSRSYRPPTSTAAAAAATTTTTTPAATHTDTKQWYQLSPWIAFNNPAAAFRDGDSYRIITNPSSRRHVHVHIYIVDAPPGHTLPAELQDETTLLCCLRKQPEQVYGRSLRLAESWVSRYFVRHWVSCSITGPIHRQTQHLPFWYAVRRHLPGTPGERPSLVYREWAIANA